MIQCKEISELEYKEYLEELKKGKSIGQAIEDAWKKGAPEVFVAFHMLRTQISLRHRTGRYKYDKHKDMCNLLDVIYEWWLKNHKPGRYKYMCLLNRMTEPAPWPVGLHSFRSHIYKYQRGEYKNKPVCSIY